VQIFNLFEDKHFKGFFTSEKVNCVKSIFYMFFKPIAYASTRNYLKPTSGGMLCHPLTWRILNYWHNFWMKITKVGICVLWMFIPTLCCFGGVPLFLVLFMENVELVIQWWNLKKQVLGIVWIICHSMTNFWNTNCHVGGLLVKTCPCNFPMNKVEI